jgi:pseudouridine synthase
MRLQRFLAQSGVAARRKAELLIRAGRVRVDGKVVTRLGTKIDPETARVSVDGKEVAPHELHYLLLNKPKGCLTTKSDEHGRKTVMEYLRGAPEDVVPVGRLDFYSEGVLLFTNDGDLAAALLSPARHVEKTYHVKIRGQLKPSDLKALREGVRIDRHVKTRPAEVDVLKSESKHDWLVMTLTEGKSRQIHRMLEARGYEVQKIQRVAFAGLTFHGLRVGDARELTQEEVNHLYELTGLAKSDRAVARGKWKTRREDTEMNRRARERTRKATPKEASKALPSGSRPDRDQTRADAPGPRGLVRRGARE